MKIIRDIIYVPDGSLSQSLDLYLPATQDRSLPLVIWIHGGAFMSGDKELNRALFLADSGFATASVNYRLTDEATFPAQIEDCKAAVRFLRAHAAEYGLDSRRFGVWGESAGGFLAAMVGTTGHLRMFEVGGHLDVAGDVQAVCDYYGPTDLTTLDDPPDPADRSRPADRLTHFGPGTPAAALLGHPVEYDLPRAHASSPIAYVTGSAPPFLIVHGDQDAVVPLGQSRQLAEALRAAGGNAKFVIFTETGHGGGLFDGPEADALVRQFFLSTL